LIPYDKLPHTPIASVNSVVVKTGAWRTFKPVINYEKCIRCMICWKFCPDVSIRLEDGNSYPAQSERIKKTIKEAPVIDYDHCKGCGICAEECPTKAIEMVPEEK